MSRTILACFSDTHAGSTRGLLNPATVLFEVDEEGREHAWKPRLRPIQRYLWRCYQSDKRSVIALAAGDPIIVIHNGDLTKGAKYPDGLVSTRQGDQYLIATANMEPWCKAPNLRAVRLTVGTDSHIFGEASSTVMVSEMMRARHPDLNLRVIYHGALTVDGVLVDYAHHGPSPGIRNWTRGNQLRYYTGSILDEHLNNRKTPPQLILRGHYHEYSHEAVRRYLMVKDRLREVITDIVVIPSYSHLSEYGRQATRSKYLIGNGMVAVEIVDGKVLYVHPFVHFKDLRTKEVL